MDTTPSLYMIAQTPVRVLTTQADAFAPGVLNGHSANNQPIQGGLVASTSL